MREVSRRILSAASAVKASGSQERFPNHHTSFSSSSDLDSILIQVKWRAMSESTDDQASSSRAASSTTEPPKKFPKGVVLGKDGKP